MEVGRGRPRALWFRFLILGVVLFSLTVVYFSDTLLGNRVWADGPALFSAYPWKTYSPYRDVAQRIELDNPTYYLPHQMFLVRALFQRGEFPLWNPFILGGTPFFASANKHALAVTNLLYAFLDFPTAVNWAVALQVFFSGLFMYVYLRSLIGRRERGPALAGALLFMFSGDLIERTFVLSVEELMWMPLALWAIHRSSQPPFRLRWPAVLGLFLSLIYLGGHEFNTPVLYAVAGVVWLVTAARGWRGWSGRFRAAFLGGGAVAAAVCVGLSAVKLLPSVENYLLSARLLSGYPIDVEPADAALPALAKQLGYVALNLAFPIRAPLILQSFGGNLFYFGFLALFCMAAARGDFRRWPAGLFGVLGLIGLTVSVFGRFSAAALTQAFGELRWVSVLRPYLQHHNQALLTTVSLPVVAALSLGRVMARAEDPSWRRRLTAVLGTVCALLLLVGAAGEVWMGEEAGHFLRNFSVWMAAGVAGGAALGFALWGRGIIGKGLLWAGMFLLLAVDLMVMTRLPFRLPDRTLWFPRTASVDFLRRQSGPFRVVAFQDYQGPWSWFSPVFPPNTAMVEGLEDIRGWTNFMWSRHAQLFSGVENSNLASLNRLYRNRIDLYRNSAWFRWLDLFNVKYVLLSNDEEDLLWPEKFRLVHSSEIRVYENTGVLPRAFLVYRYEVQDDPARAIRRLSEASFDFRTRVLLDKPLPPEFGLQRVEPAEEGGGAALPSRGVQAPAPPSRVEILDYRLNEVTLRVKTDRPGLLFLADSYHPGWRSTVDGRRAPVVPADFVFRGVPVPAGEHEVKFRFRPKSFRVGLGVSVGTLVFLLLLAAASVRRREADRTPEGAGPSGSESRP